MPEWPSSRITPDRLAVGVCALAYMQSSMMENALRSKRTLFLTHCVGIALTPHSIVAKAIVFIFQEKPWGYSSGPRSRSCSKHVLQALRMFVGGMPQLLSCWINTRRLLRDPASTLLWSEIEFHLNCRFLFCWLVFPFL